MCIRDSLISCGARLAPFDIKELRDLMETDEMALDTLGDRKTALFVIISDTDDTFNFVVSILYTQLFNLLYKHNGGIPTIDRLLALPPDKQQSVLDFIDSLYAYEAIDVGDSTCLLYTSRCV